MPITLDKIYTTLTALPYRRDEFHVEIPPCDALKPDFNVHDAAYKFGFFDQPHLLNYFRKYHSISLSEARKRARDGSRLYVK